MRERRVLRTAGGFLVAAWLDGVAAFLVIAAGGLSGGAAFALGLWLTAAGLKALALAPLLELAGLDRPPGGSLPRVLGREVLLTGAALALLLGASTAAGTPLAAEPFTVALLLETSYRLVAGASRLGFRVAARGLRALRGRKE